MILNSRRWQFLATIRIAALVPCLAFLPHDGVVNSEYSSRAFPASATSLKLIPIRNFKDEFNFLSEPESVRCCFDTDGVFQDPDSGSKFELGLVEENDLPDTSRFIVEAFGSEAIRLSQDLNSFEELIMRPAVELLNGYSGVVAFAEVLSGLKSRLCNRIDGMGIDGPSLKGLNTREEKIKASTGEALVLVVGKAHEDTDWHIDVIGSVELRLQPCDAKIPFSLPWLDSIERKLASLIGLGKNDSRDLQPYLSNLCIDEKYRGRGIAKALVHCVEDIAASKWGYTRMYLHVDLENEAALSLYKGEGYKDVGLRWKPFWAGKASDIGYFVKKMT